MSPRVLINFLVILIATALAGTGGVWLIAINKVVFGTSNYLAFDSSWITQLAVSGIFVCALLWTFAKRRYASIAACIFAASLVGSFFID